MLSNTYEIQKMPGKEATLDQILAEIIKNREETAQTKTEIKNQIQASETRLLLKFEEQRNRIDQLEKENQELRSNIELIQRGQKKNNLIIFGLNKAPKDRSVEFICQEIKQRLGVNILETDINNLYSLGQQLNSPLKIELLRFNKKHLILQNCYKLKNSGWIVVNDYTDLQREENKYLREHLNHYRKNSEERCYIKGEKLYVGNQVFTVEELQQKEIEPIPKTNSAPATPTVVQSDQENNKASNFGIIEHKNKNQEAILQKNNNKKGSGIDESPKNRIPSARERLRSKTLK